MSSDQVNSTYANMIDINKGANQNMSAGLSPVEIAQLRQVLMAQGKADEESQADSEYDAFPDSTHAWAVFADNPAKRASNLDRFVGTLIICFQLFTYNVFASEAIEDYEKGQVPVMTRHSDCIAADEQPDDNFYCEAESTNNWDACIAFFMLGIFLVSDFIQAGRAIYGAPRGGALLFACLAGIEVLAAFISASISVSYNLYIGEVADAVEVGVGLLFVRELSSRAYHGIHNKGKKEYKIFFTALLLLVVIGFFMDPFCEFLFAAPKYDRR